MKILIFAEEGTFFLYFKSAIKALCQKGHSVVFVFAKQTRKETEDEIIKLQQECPMFNFSLGFFREGKWRTILQQKRITKNYRLFLELKKKKYLSDFYSRRLLKWMPRWLRPFLRLRMNFLVTNRFAGRYLEYLEYSAPPDEKIINQIKEIAPDIVVTCFGSFTAGTPDYDYMSAAQTLGIKTALFTVSWDNIETKGAIHRMPDYLLVWNEIQKRTAINNHHVPTEKIRITGGPFFDNMFVDLKPSMSRGEFCKKYGLDPAKKILLYMGSSSIYKNEYRIAKQFGQWLAASGDSDLKNIQIVVRPHLSNYKDFKKDLPASGAVMIPMDAKTLPETPESLQLFYDTLYYSFAVSGICTSGFISAFILGKPVITLIEPKFEHIQKYAPHCRQLFDEGVLDVAENREQFTAIVKRLIEGNDLTVSARRNFIKKYVRPMGIDITAGDAFARTVEEIAATQSR